MRTTNVYLVVDQSSSMSGPKAAKQAEMVWDLINQFAAEEREGHGSYTVYVFGVGTTVESHSARPARIFTRPEVVHLTRSKPENTALFDGIGAAISSAEVSSAEADLVAIFSDGEENNSHQYNAYTLAPRIQQLTAKGKLTVTFAGPKTAYANVQQCIPAGNFKAWDGSVKEMAEVAALTSSAGQTYTQSRRAGVTRSATLYADATKLNTGAVRGFAKQVTPTETKVVSKHMDGRAIADFFKKFEPGRHYYQLIKPEYIQEDKDLVVHIKDANEYRVGSRSIRTLLGLPETGKIRVAPGPQSDKYDIYVQSASVNRKLVEGQKLLTL